MTAWWEHAPRAAPAVLLLLAAAVLVGGPRSGSVRLARTPGTAPRPAGAVGGLLAGRGGSTGAGGTSEVDASGSGTGPEVPDRPAPPLRPGWIVVGAAGAGAVGWLAAGPVAAVIGAGVAGAGGIALNRRAATPPPTAGPELAAAWELLALCLRTGLPVADAVVAAAPAAGSAGAALHRIAARLALGADPAEAWRPAEDVPALAAFARAAGRSAGTGAALARVADAEGSRIRASLADEARARAERAGVLITGPLGLCFLPAFLALGIAPVVIGLAGDVFARW